MRILTVAAALLCLLAASATAQVNFPAPTDPIGNATTPAKALLGKALFWDEQLSSPRTMACGTCHIFRNGGSDPRSNAVTHPGPDGVFGTADDIHGSPGLVQQDAAGNYPGSTTFGIRPQSTGRKAPSVINAAYENELFWDGRATSTFFDPSTGLPVLTNNAALESQASGPPQSDVEMGHMGRSWNSIAFDITNLQPLALAENIPANLAAFIAGQSYRSLFQSAFGSAGVTAERIIFAIAAYQRTLISDQTRYDAFLAGTGTLSPSEQSGFSLLLRFCIICHLDLLPSSQQTGPALNDYRKIGVRPDSDDQGRFAITGNQFELGMFKVPQLRNVELRAPYFHNGSKPDLSSVMNFYNRGGEFGPNIDPNVQFMAGQISAQDNAELVDFMLTLTDPRVQQELAPFDRPSLYSESSRVPQIFGTGTAGSLGLIPTATVETPPFLGNTKFRVGMDNAPSGMPVFLLLDFAGSTTGMPLLGQTFYLTFNATTQFIGLTAPLSASPGAGSASQGLALPVANMFAGLPIFGQWLLLDAAGPFGITSSNAFRVNLF